MTINIDSKDLINYPSITKRITVDVTSLVPTGYYGDEQIVLRVYTTAYSDNIARTAIQDIYITEGKVGWCKSSGFKGSKFPLSSSANELRIKMDATVSGSDGSGYYTIQLNHNSGVNIDGEDVAEDIQNQIRAVATTSGVLNVADTGFALAYRNAVVEFDAGKFKVYSGTIGDHFTGVDRSSVTVVSGLQNDCSVLLGFDLSTTSEGLASQSVTETYLLSPYTAGSGTLYVVSGAGIETGDACIITDGTNTDYFTVLNIVSDSTITVADTATNGFDAIANSYSTARIQKLRTQDPEGEPNSLYSIDHLARHGIMSIINQIDYSS